MDMISVSSSTIASVGYDGKTSTLRIQFLKGGTYEYQKVPSNVYGGLLAAQSKGKYFDEHIKKGGYSYSKV